MLKLLFNRVSKVILKTTTLHIKGIVLYLNQVRSFHKITVRYSGSFLKDVPLR